MATIAILVVAGGGGGGYNAGGGGGGGGYKYESNLSVTAGSYLITVGDGGNGSTDAGSPGANGGNSSIGALLEATGGGGGGSFSVGGANGGSGGGGAGNNGSGHAPGSASPVGQGNDGGTGSGAAGYYPAAGGGGSGSVGQSPAGGGSIGGNGGSGTSNSITGSALMYAGGGGGSAYAGGAGSGQDGGGNGGAPGGGNGGAGTSDTGGGGGGGGGSSNGGKGGSGVVVIRYLTSSFGVCTGGTKTTDGSYTIHKFVLADSGTNFVVALDLFTREAKTTLPTDGSDLATVYSAQDILDVASDDATRVAIVATGGKYGIHNYKKLHGNNTDGIAVHWNGQSDVGGAQSTIYLQIYNFNTPGWETLASNNSIAANTDFDLDGSITTNISNYYDGSNNCLVRVYQKQQ